MAAWGGVGLAGAGLARVAGRELGRIPLAAACAVASLGFGAVMNLHLWITLLGRPHGGQAGGHVRDLAAVRHRAHDRQRAVLPRVRARRSCARSRATGGGSRSAGCRCRRRRSSCSRSWRSPSRRRPRARRTPPTRPPPAPPCATWSRRRTTTAAGAARPASPPRSSTRGWTAIGLAAAGRNPRDVGSPSAVAYIRDHAGELNDLGEINRTIIVLVAGGRRAAPGRPRPGGRAGRRAAAQRLVRRAREHDRVRHPRAARGRPRPALARRPPRGRLHRRRGQRRRRLQLRRPGRAVGDRRHERGAAGAGRRRPAP